MCEPYHRFSSPDLLPSQQSTKPTLLREFEPLDGMLLQDGAVQSIRFFHSRPIIRV
jgi:hypothetical protein